jgi:hypothetical protein
VQQLKYPTMARIDTCQWSFLHRIFGASEPGKRSSLWRQWVRPWAACALLMCGAQLIIAYHAGPEVIAPPSTTKWIGALYDHNMFFMSLIMLPVLLSYLLAERTLIPMCIERLAEAGILTFNQPDPTELCSRWIRIYRYTNATIQGFALLAVALISYSTYLIWMSGTYRGWQIAPNGQINMAGWFYLLWFLPLFWGIVIIYVLRGVTTMFFFRHVVSASKIHVELFHPDNAGGLSAVATIGIRNQYILTLAGLNAISFILMARTLEAPFPTVTSQPTSASLPEPWIIMIAIALSVYMAAAPMLFLGPLLPFRCAMRANKREQLEIVGKKLREEHERILQDLFAKGFAKDSEEHMERLQKLRASIASGPEWPFDIQVRVKFVVAYVLPVLATLLVPVLNKASDFLSHAIGISK